MLVAASKGVIIPLLSEVTTGTGEGVQITSSTNNLRIHFRSVGVVASGTVVLEEAQSASYTGTWSIVFTHTAVTDSEQVLHLPGIFSALRARLSANIVGGALMTVELVCN